jgi:hypothetical protein
MIMDAPWYSPNTVIRKDLQIPTVKHEISRPQRAPKLINFRTTGTIRNKSIEKELANRCAYQIQYVIVVTINTVFKV